MVTEMAQPSCDGSDIDIRFDKKLSNWEYMDYSVGIQVSSKHFWTIRMIVQVYLKCVLYLQSGNNLCGIGSTRSQIWLFHEKNQTKYLGSNSWVNVYLSLWQHISEHIIAHADESTAIQKSERQEWCLNTVIFVALIEYDGRICSVTYKLVTEYCVLGSNLQKRRSIGMDSSGWVMFYAFPQNDYPFVLCFRMQVVVAGRIEVVSRWYGKKAWKH